MAQKNVQLLIPVQYVHKVGARQPCGCQGGVLRHEILEPVVQKMGIPPMPSMPHGTQGAPRESPSIAPSDFHVGAIAGQSVVASTLRVVTPSFCQAQDFHGRFPSSLASVSFSSRST